MMITGVWRRLGVSRLVMTLLLAATAVLLCTHTSSTPTLTHLNTRVFVSESLLEGVGRSGEGGAPLGKNDSHSGVDVGQLHHGRDGEPDGTTHVLLQAGEMVNVKEAVQPVEGRRAAHGLVRQPSATSPHQQFPFRYVINEPGLCHPGVNIINMIPVAPNRISSRLLIREMWGSQQFTVLTKMKTVFVLGSTTSAYYQRHLQAESNTYHDIIQLDFTDSYLNLTLKTLSMLHWTQTFCHSANWILKSDDDVFVNPFALSNFLKHYPWVSFVCRMNTHLEVCRVGQDCQQKWAVSYEEYAEDYYPPYCNGPAYVVSTNMSRRIYVAANKTHPHIMEDAYFTGVVARALHPTYQKLPRIRFPKITPYFLTSFWNGVALFLQNLEKKKGASRALWNKILQHNNISTPSLTRQ